MIRFYNEIILILNEAVNRGQLTQLDQKTILDLLYKAMIRVTSKNEQLMRVVSEMAMPLIECEFERADRLEKLLKQTQEEKKELLSKAKEELSKSKDELREKDTTINEQAIKIAELEAILKNHGITV